MNQSINTSIRIAFMLLFMSPIYTTGAQDFGKGADMKKLVAISTILASPKQFLEKDVTVKGEIVAVCENKGCWVKLASDKKFQTLRIKVRDGDMVFPVSAKGKTAYATGLLTAKTLSKEKAVAYLQHMADESKDTFDPASITKGITIYELVPKGVTIAEG